MTLAASKAPRCVHHRQQPWSHSSPLSSWLPRTKVKWAVCFAAMLANQGVLVSRCSGRRGHPARGLRAHFTGKAGRKTANGRLQVAIYSGRCESPAAKAAHCMSHHLGPSSRCFEQGDKLKDSVLWSSM